MSDAVDWKSWCLTVARRDALKAASEHMSEKAKTAGGVLEGKLTDAARAHLEELEAAYIHAATELMKEAAQ